MENCDGCLGHHCKNTFLKLFRVLSALSFPENWYVFSCLEMEEVNFIRISPEIHYSLNLMQVCIFRVMATFLNSFKWVKLGGTEHVCLRSCGNMCKIFCFWSRGIKALKENSFLTPKRKILPTNLTSLVRIIVILLYSNSLLEFAVFLWVAFTLKPEMTEILYKIIYQNETSYCEVIFILQ